MAAASGPVKQPCGWADIAVGAVVLAMRDAESNWYEAEVIAAYDGDRFTLRWRHAPDWPLVGRRVELALMHPARPNPAV